MSLLWCNECVDVTAAAIFLKVNVTLAAAGKDVVHKVAVVVVDV